jgi:hypothetical protein
LDYRLARKVIILTYQSTSVGVLVNILAGGFLGLAIGLATGLSETEGTVKRAIIAITTLAGGGGMIGIIGGQDQAGWLVVSLSVGFISGMLIGSLLREGFVSDHRFGVYRVPD